MSVKPAFTLLEVLFVMLIVGLFMSMVIPNFLGRGPRYERELFITRLNAITQLAWQQALVTHKIHMVHFDFTTRRVRVEVAQEGASQKGALVTVPMRGLMQSSFVWPVHIAIKDFFIERVNEMSGRTIKSAYFVLMPEGLAQEVTINFIDKKDTIAGRARKFGLVLNPFSAQFKVYDTFQT